MDFKQAIDSLVKGHYLVREGWEAEGKYLVFMPGMKSVWQILTMPNPNAGNYLFLVDDFLANDWKEISELPAQEVQKAA